MKRRLRIAVSVFFALVAVAVAVLWVRSYWRLDRVFCRAPGSRYGHTLQAYHGRVSIITHRGDSNDPAALQARWHWSTETLKGSASNYFDTASFQLVRQGNRTVLMFAYWMPLFAAALLSALCGVRRPNTGSRFSIRMLFLGITLVAIVLGLVVWMGRFVY